MRFKPPPTSKTAGMCAFVVTGFLAQKAPRDFGYTVRCQGGVLLDFWVAMVDIYALVFVIEFLIPKRWKRFIRIPTEWRA